MEEAVSYDRVKMVLDELMAECEKEIPYHYQYLDELRKTEDSIWTSLANREKSIATILRFAELRPEYMKQQLSELLRY